MSITETTPSPQHKLHWLAEQARNWSGLPVVHVRPTVLLEGFFLILTPDSVKESNQIRLPVGDGKTSPVAVEDVARVIAALLANPQPHIGKIYHLTGAQSENMDFAGTNIPVAVIRGPKPRPTLLAWHRVRVHHLACKAETGIGLAGDCCRGSHREHWSLCPP